MNKIENILLQTKFIQNKNWLKAVNILKEAINKYPQEKMLYKNLADIYSKQKLYRKAIENYQYALFIDVNDENINYLIGNCFLSLKEPRLAIDYYNKVKITFPELLYNKAVAYSNIKKYEIGIDIIKELLKLNATSEVPYVLIAELYISLNKFDDAINYLITAEKIVGKSGILHYMKGATYSHKKIWLKAYFEFQNADKFKMNIPHFYRSYAVSCEKIGKINKAIDLLKKNINLEPNDTPTYIELLKIYLTHENFSKAFELINAAKKNIPFTIPLLVLYDELIHKIKS
ncbi:MAG: hypothetical protein DRJ01_16900 [Bacteroidetes bacterium]|nr:MAG: hypothetical protein DRJ01_16900 [Bacteroidota bacterium]